MKKLFSIVLAIAALASTLNACSFFQKEMNKENENSRYYEQLGQAVEVSKDTLILRTPDGNEWVWGIEKGERFKLNKLYNITFDTLGTPGIRDDAIVKIIEKGA